MSVVNNWVGAVDDTSSWVRAKVDGSNAELFLSTSSDMAGEVSAGTGSATAQGIVSIRASGLDSDTTYYWQVEDADGTRGPTGRFHTHVPAGDPFSFTFAAFGDAGLNPEFPGSGDELDPNRVSNHPGFDTVRLLDPLFVMHQGDLHYYNLGGATNAGTLANYRTAYDDVLDQPRQHQLYREVPIVYSWDDHDYGPNNSDGTHPDKDNAAQVYRERVPHYPLAESTGPIYRSFQVGRVLFICADVRYNRSPNDDPDDSTKTMLGSSQKTWMDNLLSTSTAEALVWQMPSQWMGSSNDSWDSFRHERDELVTMFGDRGWLSRMCIISADWHGIGIDTGIGNLWGGFPVFHFASIDCSSGGSQPFNLGSSPGRNRYGTMRVVDDGDLVRVTGTAWIGSSSWESHTWTSRHELVMIPVVGLNYTSDHVSPPFEPTEDDQLLRNDVTVERDGGSSARAVQQTGPLSVEAVGRYDESTTINIASDDPLPNQASWRVHLGTVDKPRYPEVTVNLTDNQDLIGDVSAVESGDRFTIANVPDWLPPGNVEAIAQGYTETLTSFIWEWTATTSPAEPWTVAVADHEVLGRADTSGSELDAAAGSSDTSLSVAVTDGPLWITDLDFPEFPFDVEAGGEVMRVTGISGDASPQTLTVERSINGVTKSHDAGTELSLAYPAVVAL